MAQIVYYLERSAAFLFCANDLSKISKFVRIRGQTLDIGDFLSSADGNKKKSEEMSKKLEVSVWWFQLENFRHSFKSSIAGDLGHRKVSDMEREAVGFPCDVMNKLIMNYLVTGSNPFLLLRSSRWILAFFDLAGGHPYLIWGQLMTFSCYL